MKTFFAFVLTLFCSLCSGCSSQEDFHWDKMSDIKGPVKLVKETRYNVSLDSGEVILGDVNLTHIRECNTDGRLTRDLIQNADGTVLSDVNNMYNNGNLVKSEIVSSGVHTTYLVTKNTGSYRKLIEEGNDNYVSETKWKAPIQSVYVNGDLSVEVIYNDSCSLALEQKQYINGKQNSRLVFDYDENGNLVRLTNFISEDLSFDIVYEYTAFDSKGNWTTRIESSGDGHVKSVQKREIAYY